MEKLEVKKTIKTEQNKNNKDEKSLNFLNSKNKKKLINEQKKHKNIKKNPSKLKIFLKNSNIISILNKNKTSIIILFILLFLTTVLCFITFSNNTYFMFLNRPKILENGFLLSLIIFIFLLLLVANFILQVYLNDKSNNLKDGDKNNIDKLEFKPNILSSNLINKNPENNNEKSYLNINEFNNEENFKNLEIKSNSFVKKTNQNIVKSTFQNKKLENKKIKEKDKKISFSIKNSLKINNFKQYFIIFLQFLILVLAFHLQILWLCVFISFCTFFSLFILLYKFKKVQNKIFCVILLLIDICILLSFYFIYLLN